MVNPAVVVQAEHGAMIGTCPVCSEETPARLVEDLRACAFYRCSTCGLQYLDPLPEGVPVFEDYSDYGQDLLDSIARGESINNLLASNEEAVLDWLMRSIPQNVVILELCCESGRFLAALRSVGFVPFGMDPLARPIGMLAAKGFRVRVGSVEDVPGDWPEPAAVVVLESLVRFPDPLQFLRGIRQRFPRARLCLSVPSPRRSLKVPAFDRRLDYPPHHLTRWTPRALLTALAKAGYRGTCRLAHVDLHWRRGYPALRVAKILFSISLRLLGESEYSLLAYGTPA